MTVSSVPQEKVSIEGYDVEKIMYKDQPVITFKMMDQIHERPDGTAGRNFRQNRDRFIENEDFYTVPLTEWRELKCRRNSSANTECRELKSVRNSYANSEQAESKPITLLTVMGYMMLVKSFTDDRAWKVQHVLATSYFQIRRVLTCKEQNQIRKQLIISRRLDLDTRKTELAMLKQSKIEAERIFKGNGSLDDLHLCPELQAMTRAALEELKKGNLFKSSESDDGQVAAPAENQPKKGNEL